MNQTAPVSCIPAGKMSKAKKVLDEAREIQNPELDLADKGIATFEEMPGLRESRPQPCASLAADRQIRQLALPRRLSGRSAARPSVRSRGRDAHALSFESDIVRCTRKWNDKQWEM